tara:strand:+ start:327 stop:701 length:375 start_codon:yes stop_codon:yes gene_type:complete
VVAIVILRFKPAEAVRRKGLHFADIKYARERLATFTKLVESVGLSVWQIGRTLDDRNVVIMEGSADEVMMLQQVMSATGAFDSIEAEIIEHFDAILTRAERVRKIAADYRPPNEDEIDRMLLDE